MRDRGRGWDRGACARGDVVSRPILDARLMREVHAAFDGRYTFLERSGPSDVSGTYHLGVARTAVNQLLNVVSVVAGDALVNWSGVQPFHDRRLADAFAAYLALRWCYNAGVDAGAILGHSPLGSRALTGICSNIMDEPAQLAWDQVPWERLAYALHLAARPLGLAIDGRHLDPPEGWEP